MFSTVPLGLVKVAKTGYHNKVQTIQEIIFQCFFQTRNMRVKSVKYQIRIVLYVGMSFAMSNRKTASCFPIASLAGKHNWGLCLYINWELQPRHMNTNVPPAFYRKHTLWMQISRSVLQEAHIVDTNFPQRFTGSTHCGYKFRKVTSGRF